HLKLWLMQISHLNLSFKLFQLAIFERSLAFITTMSTYSMRILSIFKEITLTATSNNCVFFPACLTSKHLRTSQTAISKGVHLHFYQIICLSCCCHIYKYSISIPLHIASALVVITFDWI